MIATLIALIVLTVAGSMMTSVLGAIADEIGYLWRKRR